MAVESTPILVAVAAAASAVLVKTLDAWSAAKGRSGDAAQRRQEFFTSLLAQERARYESILEEYRSADRQERHDQRSKIAVLEARIMTLERRTEECQEELSARKDITEHLRDRLARYERVQPYDGG